MKNIISKEWKKLKAELEESLEEAKEKGNVDKEVLELMQQMLENSKLKNRRHKNNE
mgnify:CR=1 FL=1